MTTALGNDSNANAFTQVGDAIIEKELASGITLAQAKHLSEKLYAFVSENNHLISQADNSGREDYLFMADALRVAIQRMNTTTAIPQT
jgi:hypothetical protein